MTYLPVYLESIKISKTQQSQLYAVMAVGLWVAPFVVGQVADRWPGDREIAGREPFLRGGISLYALATAMELYNETAANFQSLIWLVGIFAVAYMAHGSPGQRPCAFAIFPTRTGNSARCVSGAR